MSKVTNVVSSIALKTRCGLLGTWEWMDGMPVSYFFLSYFDGMPVSCFDEMLSSIFLRMNGWFG